MADGQDSAVGLHRQLPFRPNLGRMATPSVADRLGPTHCGHGP